MREYSFGCSFDLGATIPDGEFEKLVGIGKLMRYLPNECLYRQGDPADHMYVLLAGTAKSFSVNSAGQETVLRIHLPGSLLGLTALGSHRRRDASAMALEPVDMSVIPRERLLAFLSADGPLAVYVARLLVDRLMEFQYRVSELAANSVEQRLARALLVLGRADPAAPAAGGERAISLTHEELSHIVGARRQTVTAALNRFAELGLVRLVRRRIVITDPAGLALLLPDGGDGDYRADPQRMSSG